jgi:hypothetical protein
MHFVATTRPCWIGGFPAAQRVCIEVGKENEIS